MDAQMSSIRLSIKTQKYLTYSFYYGYPCMKLLVIWRAFYRYTPTLTRMFQTLKEKTELPYGWLNNTRPSLPPFF